MATKDVGVRSCLRSPFANARRDGSSSAHHASALNVSPPAFESLNHPSSPGNSGGAISCLMQLVIYIVSRLLNKMVYAPI